MYSPSHFSNNESVQIKKLIEENSFVLIMSFPENDEPFINHLPLVFCKNANEENVMIGHMAKRNPQWQHFSKNKKAIVVVNGPHAYITPKWYSDHDVPTWNYAVVHLHGKIELCEAYQEQINTLKQMSDFYESKRSNPWTFDLPSDLLDEKSLTSAIVSFKFHIEKIEAKFKLSQNRSKEDFQGVINGLSERADEMSLKVRQLMLESKTRA